MRKTRKTWGRYCVGICLAFLCEASVVHADDAVGVFRIDAVSNETVEMAMPFDPLATNRVADFIAGNFVGNGCDGSDRLWQVSSRGGGITQSVFSDGVWVDSADGGMSPVRVLSGDAIVFRPGVNEPTSVYVFGRVPTDESLSSTLFPGWNLVSLGYPSSIDILPQLPNGASGPFDMIGKQLDAATPPWWSPFWITNATDTAINWSRTRPYEIPDNGLPQIAAFSVDVDSQTVRLTVDAGGCVTDLFRLQSDEGDGFDASKAWSHLARFIGNDADKAVWTDPLPSGNIRASFYHFTNAKLDTDGDGLPDALERLVYGTSPLLADTDGDGVSDALEVAAGTDPLVPESGFGFRFADSFERPFVVPGPLDGQNGWTVTRASFAIVQTNSFCNGVAALELRQPIGAGIDVEASHSLSGAPQTVWIDVRVSDWSGFRKHEPDPLQAAAFSFDGDGHPVMFVADGGAVTNLSVQVCDDVWTRCTAMLDCGRRVWDYYVNGGIVGKGLSMGGVADTISEIAVSGLSGRIDGLIVSSARPTGLSSDGDALPDEWEVEHFGWLGRDGSGDADGDGISDYDELRLGTDPMSSDTDDDGLPDFWEVTHGLDPLGAADASEDPDGDGLDNATEFALGTDPNFSEPDPRMTLPGLRAEFRRTNGLLLSLPDFDALPNAFALSVSSVVNHPAEDSWLDDGASPGDFFACRLTGFIRIAEDGDYVFRVMSDDGFSLRIDGVEVVRDSTPHGTRIASGSVRLSAGWRPIEVLYYENAGQEVLRLEWEGPSLARTVIPAAALCHIPQNLPPRLASSTDSSWIFEGEAVTVSAEADDLDGDVVKVAVFDDDGEIALMSAPSIVSRIGWLAEGVHVIAVVAWDNSGAATTNLHEIEVRSVPQGYDSGLAVSFYSFDHALASMPEFDGVDPISTGIVTAINYPKTVSAWEGAPTNLVSCFGATFTGALWIEESGLYDVALTSDDGARLFFDERLAIDNDGMHSMTTRTTQIPLSRGMHPLRLEYFENDGEAGLSLSLADASDNDVDLRFFHRIGGTDDTDGDGMPDWWENLYELDPFDASDADRDPDDDGLVNLREFLAGTNPRIADTDRDGMPDAWEAMHGLCPFVADGVDDDFDGDGLSNLAEFLAGTDPANSDTDGDGVSDGDECILFFSDPLTMDIDGTCTTNAVLSCSDIDKMRGMWSTDGDALTLLERAGAVSFPDGIRLAEPGIREVRLSVAFAGEFDADFVCRVDGRMAGVVTLGASATVHERPVRFLSPWLSAGAHSLEFELQNFSNDRNFSLSDVAICTPNGPDTDGDGVPDWIDSRRRASRCNRSGIIRSRISPFCLRGRSPRPSLVSASIGTPVRVLPDFEWWTDIPLSPSEARDVTVTYEDGFKTERVSVIWEPFDVLSETNIILRRGDSLLLSAPDGASVTLDGVLVEGGDSGVTPMPFDTAGERVLECRTEDGRENTLTVTVVDIENADDFPVWRGKTNSIDVKRSGFGAVSIVSDAGAAIATQAVRQREMSINLAVSAVGRPNCFAFEIPNADASIAGSVGLCPFSAYYTLERKYYIFGRLADGTSIVENRLSAFDIPPGLTMSMTSGSGICFEDGAGVLKISADDFDEIGDFSYLFYIPQGVMHPCQFLRLIVDGKAVAQ